MKYITYSYKEKKSLGVLIDSNVIDLHLVSNGEIPNNMSEFLINFEQNHSWVCININKHKSNSCSLSDVILHAPLENPNSFRDAYAFREHVAAGRKSRGLGMIPEYDLFPVFYFSNHNAICGPGEVEIQKAQSFKLDYELEIAAVIGKEGRNISVDKADDYIAGYTIMNDLSARSLQKEEMKLNLGPAKGKDFSTSIGPYIITKDDLEHKILSSKDGDRYNLSMRAFVNGKLLSEDNFKNITWTFAQIISRVSDGVNIYPGDIIGSGTCATGCLLELNQTKNSNVWLKNGDEIKLEIDELSFLENTLKFI